MRKQWLRLLAALLALTFVAAACTSDDATTAAGDGDDTESSADDEEAEDEDAEGEDEDAMEEEDPEAPADDEDEEGDDAAASGDGVTIFGPESSDEEAGAFQEALAVWSEESGVAVTYVGASDFSDQINVQIAGGNPPDIAIFPQPGKVADFARSGDILALPDEVNSAIEWGADWTAFGNVDDTQYGIPVKADLKSLVWYQPGVFEEKGYEVPETFDDFVALTETMIGNGDTPLCVGIESDAATGWTFTDWVEDMILRVHGADVYDQWVSHEIPFNDDRIQEVFNQVRDIWDTEGMVFASGGSIATTSFRDNGQPLVDGDCLMHRQANFYAGFMPEGTPFADGSEGAVDVFYFPSTGADKPVLGAGTLATSFTDSEDVWAVMEYLGSATYAENRQKAQAELNGGGLSGFLSAAEGQDPSIYQPLEQSFLEILSSSEVVRFDASDLMPSEVGSGSFWSEGTSFVNGDIDAAAATQAIEDSWP